LIEKDFDVSFVAQLARREKQIQQSYRPIIGVHKWFARRPGTLFRALLLAEFANDLPLVERFFHSQDLSPRVVGDPFMGGGTPLFEANRVGCHVVGTDINPMAYWIVRQELSPLDRERFRSTAKQVIEHVKDQIGHLYETTCEHCHNPHAPVKYFLWIKQEHCSQCGASIDLFSKYVVAKNQRHPQYVLVCPYCGDLTETPTLKPEPGPCQTCDTPLSVKGPAASGNIHCPQCGTLNHYPSSSEVPPTHRLYAMEYHCPHCKPNHQGRFFKAPDEKDLSNVKEAETLLQSNAQSFIPTEEIPPGDETSRLHRWGYHTYRSLFNPRQLLSLQTLANEIANVDDKVIRHALLTVFSDTLRYQNMLCRYDTYALKIIDIFSVHGFPVSLAQCENSVLGIPKTGSGAFRHFVAKYDRAKAYCERPFEKALSKSRRKITLHKEKIEATLIDDPPGSEDTTPRRAYLKAMPATGVELPADLLDAVFTDPPYFANVQYAELMDFCYVWLRKHLADEIPAFRPLTTRAPRELTVNETEGRDILDFTRGLSKAFQAFTRALKPEGPFVFTYHHNETEAYLPVAAAILDANLVSTVTLPCPAEMGASIHISGTQSSVIDTVFVCRQSGKLSPEEFKPTVDYLKRRLKRDVRDLKRSGYDPTAGDLQCILLGHLTRLAVWQLHSDWDTALDTEDKLDRIRAAFEVIISLDTIDTIIDYTLTSTDEGLLDHMITREAATYDKAYVSF
jgi:adenine-specific DNA methylase